MSEPFRPALSPEMTREVNFLAAYCQMSPVNFVRACVAASIAEFRYHNPELDRALNNLAEPATMPVFREPVAV